MTLKSMEPSGGKTQHHEHPELSPEAWDGFVLENGGNFLQSWGWGAFQEAMGTPVKRILFSRFGASEPLMVAQVLVHGLPMGRKYAYVPRGPVFFLKTDPADMLPAFEAVVAAAKEARTIFLRADLPFLAGDSPLEPEPSVAGGSSNYGSSGERRLAAGLPALLAKSGFRHAKSMQPQDSLIMDLAKDEPTLLADMHQKARYNIRIAERHGVTVRFAAPDAVAADTFWRLLAETAERDKFHTHERAYYEKMLVQLGPGENKNTVVRLAFAEHEGEVIAAALLIDFGGTVTYLHGASLAQKRNVMAPHLLHWKAILDAKARGFRRYDFWGIAPTDAPEHPWAGVTRFKRGFGGQAESYIGAWELPIQRLWYSLYRYGRMVLRG